MKPQQIKLILDTLAQELSHERRKQWSKCAVHFIRALDTEIAELDWKTAAHQCEARVMLLREIRDAVEMRLYDGEWK